MKYIPNSVSRKFGSLALKGQQNSPAILFAVGVGAGVATVVTACRATLRVEEILEEAQNDLDNVKALQHRDRITEEDHKKTAAYIYVRTAGRLGKLYGPSIALGVITVASLTQSHRILSRRNAALTAAYAVVEKSFNEYRGRVREELGDDKDREFMFGTKTETITEKTESGTKKTKVTTLAGPSMYARMFDETHHLWQQTPSWNEAFLKAQQEYANQRLMTKGWLTLNDVYEALGYEKTKAGMVVGWKWDSDKGDNYIDFGLGDWPSAEDFAFGREHAVLLDFNCYMIFDEVK